MFVCECVCERERERERELVEIFPEFATNTNVIFEQLHILISSPFCPGRMGGCR